jgi:formylglycine-generating enzyme required for sulfatase activity
MPTEQSGLVFSGRNFSAEELRLIKEEQAPFGMAKVDGSSSEAFDWAPWYMPGLESAPHLRLGNYWMDKYEVTNGQFKAFVEQGGYGKREYWKHPFIEKGRALTWDEAMARFHDTTGRSGPPKLRWANTSFLSAISTAAVQCGLGPIMA